ncbi:hypothetical protein [Subtercola lobariae]|uniref:Uncharacterized protein n=1 Tax=Subtercola lobariae TaxID=1588641 RepID=A0A917ETH8_9MICO|nr:hypothetical protein [Subtercola lobariae]GGF11370.1 hypothetical protein GCM10011399_01500 [Subtercola lobariae]
MDAPEGWVPEFKGQRPPFQPGNQVALGNRGTVIHGSRSERHVEPIARQIAKDLRATAGLDYLSTPRFAGPLMDYCRAEARARLLEVWMQDMSMEKQAGAGRVGDPPLEMLRQAEVRARGLAIRIGLYPDVPEDVQEQIAAARKTLAKRADAKQLQANLRESIAADWDRRRQS